MKYEDNRSSLDLLKKMFLKFNKHSDKFQIGHDHNKRHMGEIFATLNEDHKKEYQAWEEVQIMLLQIEKEKNQ